MQYFTNEVALNLPEGGFGDSTVNVIQLAQQKASFVIGRGQLEEGEDLKASFERQLRHVSQQVKGLESEPAKETQLGQNESISGLETQNRLMLGDDRIYQYQLAFILPETRTMMSMTYSRSEPMTEADAAHWTSIKAGIRLRAK